MFRPVHSLLLFLIMVVSVPVIAAPLDNWSVDFFKMYPSVNIKKVPLNKDSKIIVSGATCNLMFMNNPDPKPGSYALLDESTNSNRSDGQLVITIKDFGLMICLLLRDAEQLKTVFKVLEFELSTDNLIVTDPIVGPGKTGTNTPVPTEPKQETLAPAPTPEPEPAPEGDLLGFTVFKNNSPVKDLAGKTYKMGGISGCQYLAKTERLICINDSPTDATIFEYKIKAPAIAGGLSTFEAALAHPIKNTSKDGYEDIAFLSNGNFFISEEPSGIDPNLTYEDYPYIQMVDVAAKTFQNIPILSELIPHFCFNSKKYSYRSVISGMEYNKAIEALSVDPSENFLVYATENTTADYYANVSRVVVKDLNNHQADRVYDYEIEDQQNAGVSAIIALGAEKFLVLERSYDEWKHKSRAQVYIATVSAEKKYKKNFLLKKELLINLKTLVQLFPAPYHALDNFEGMTFGPPAADGSPTLIFATDNNFSFSQEQIFMWVKPFSKF